VLIYFAALFNFILIVQRPRIWPLHPAVGQGRFLDMKLLGKHRQIRVTWAVKGK
jgi:hypothetical protein